MITLFQITSLLAVLLAGPSTLVPEASPASTASAANYTLEVGAPTLLAQGEKGVVEVKITPTSGWHMNLDFPTSLSLDGSPALGLRGAKLGKTDAHQLDDSALVFRVPISGASAGEQSISGKLRFAVCSGDACAPARESFSAAIRVK